MKTCSANAYVEKTYLVINSAHTVLLSLRLATWDLTVFVRLLLLILAIFSDMKYVFGNLEQKSF